MKKLFKKFKIKNIILFLCILSPVLILLIGASGILVTRKNHLSVDSMYEYYNWTKNITSMESSILQMHIELEEASDNFSNMYVDNLKELNEQVSNEYNLFTATECDENEQALLDKFSKAYSECYSLIDESYSNLKASKNLSSETEDRLDILFETMLSSLQELDLYVMNSAMEEMEASDKLFISSASMFSIVIILAILFFSFLAYIVINFLKTELASILSVLNIISDGDLSTKVEANGESEFDEMKIYINKMVDNLSSVINSTKEKSNYLDNKSNNLMVVSEELSASSSNILSTVENISSATEDQAKDIIEISYTLNEFTKTITDFITELTFVNNSSNNISKEVTISSTKMDDLMNTFNIIEDNVQSFIERISSLAITINEVSALSEIINNIADQTNLLALNAAIESARVGEAGKGFAVVADEIQKLAEESKKSAGDITSLLKDISKETSTISKDGIDINNKVKNSSSIINDSISSFKDIINNIDMIIPKINTLTSMSKTINDDSISINKRAENASSISEEISASSEEIVTSLKEMSEGTKIVSDSATELTEISASLENEIEIFII